MSDLSELFDRDPLMMSKQDIIEIVKRTREGQTQFELGAKPAPKEKAKKSTKTEALLKDLGL